MTASYGKHTVKNRHIRGLKYVTLPELEPDGDPGYLEISGKNHSKNRRGLDAIPGTLTTLYGKHTVKTHHMCRRLFFYEFVIDSSSIVRHYLLSMSLKCLTVYIIIVKNLCSPGSALGSSSGSVPKTRQTRKKKRI
jgi:hypothetical protein